MKIIVDLEDFWLEEDDSLLPALQEFVKREVIKEISASIKNQVDTFLTTSIKQKIEETLPTRMELIYDAFFTENRIKDGYNGEVKTISEFVGQKVRSIQPDITKMVNAAAGNQVNELKNRYDLLFATQLVNKLNEQGMLKENVAQILLDGDVKP